MSSSPATTTIPDDPPILGRYRVYGELAAGGMATVHFAKLVGAAGFSRVVALKRLHRHLATDPAFRAMLLDEARLSARVNHPNVVRTLDVLEDGDDVVIVMDYVLGESLSRAVRGGRAPVDVAVAIVVDVLNGLHAAHEARDAHGAPLAIVHRDISPQNILVGADGVAHVIDFGIAKAATRLASTTGGMTKGKQRYMAPEQLLGETVSRETDVYSAAVVLWELLAGEALFEGAKAEALVARAMSEVTRAPSDAEPSVPPALDALVLRALSRSPNARFPTARAMAQELAQTVHPATPEAVAAWLDAVAGDALEIAREQIARIERHEPAAETSPAASSVRALDGVAWPSELPTKALPSVSVRRRSRAWIIAGAIVVALGGAAFFVLGATREHIADVTPIAAASPSSGASAQVAPSASAPPEAPPSTTAPASPSASARRASPPQIASAPLAPAVRATTTATAATPATPTAGTAPANPQCSPPFVFDDQGHKIYKPDCFH